MWIARNGCFDANEGFAGVQDEGFKRALSHHQVDGAVIVGSERAHYSIAMAAGLLGLGSRSFVTVPVDGDQRVDIRALNQALFRCQQQCHRVIAVVGMAGTTDCGSIDPLMEISRLARKYGVQFHVDAAWGFPMIFSGQHRQLLAGIEQADSITTDGHKQFYLPIGNSLVLFRDPYMAQVIEQTAPYTLHEESGDLGQYSLEGSRPGGVLYWHAALRIISPLG